MIAFGRAGWATTESIPQLAGALRLDQISALYELIGARRLLPASVRS